MSEETWRDLLAYDEPKGFKPPHWCVVLFEVTIFLLAGIGAALLRFTDWSPIYQRTDLDELCYYSSFLQPALSDDYTITYYTISIALPFIMVIICEIERSYYSANPKYKLFTGIQRFFYLSLRPLGMFILGIFLISIITDYIKVQVTWPRPYFFIENREFCRNTTIMRGALTMKQRFGLTSFPCHLSSVSGFTAFLAACYAHSSVSLNAAPLIKPAIVASLFLITVSGSIYRVEIHYNHYIDIMFGLGIGSFFAFIVNSVLLQCHKIRTKVMAEAACKLLLPRVALPKYPLKNGNINGGTATIHTIRSHTSQQSKGGRPFSEA